MFIKESIVFVAAVLAVVGNVSYVRDVFRGVVKPHPYTWFIWSIVSLVTFFGQVQKGAGIGAIPTGVAEAFTIVIFLFSLAHIARDGVGHIRKIDHVFLAIALLGLIPWALTNDPTISVIVVVAIDVVAFIPTLRKTWMHPETERPLLYQMNIARHALTLFSLQAYNIATTLHSIAMICTNMFMTYCIQRKKWIFAVPVCVGLVALGTVAYTKNITLNIPPTMKLALDELSADVDADGDIDKVFVASEDSMGSGTFFYVVGNIRERREYTVSEPLFVGDRIVPQAISYDNGVVTVRYLDRAIDEPFSAPPTIEKNIKLVFNSQHRVFDVVR